MHSVPDIFIAQGAFGGVCEELGGVVGMRRPDPERAQNVRAVMVFSSI